MDILQVFNFVSTYPAALTISCTLASREHKWTVEYFSSIKEEHKYFCSTMYLEAVYKFRDLPLLNFAVCI